MQNNRQTGPASGGRPLLLILAIGLLLVTGAAGFSIFCFPAAGRPGTTPATPPAPTVPGSPGAGSGGPCTPSSPYGFTTIHADSQLVSVYRQLDVCWVRYQYHWSKIETAAG